MSCVSVVDVYVLNNPSKFDSPLQFEISFDCQTPIQGDLDWCLTYVGSGEDKKYDQILEELALGPIQLGRSKFILQADPPNIQAIPEDDVLGATAILLTCAYKGKVFFQVGYIVHNEIEEGLPEGTQIDSSKITRNIVADHPRVTLIPNGWDDPGYVEFSQPNDDHSVHSDVSVSGSDMESDENEGDVEVDWDDDEDSEESVLSDPGDDMEDNTPVVQPKPFNFARR